MKKPKDYEYHVVVHHHHHHKISLTSGGISRLSSAIFLLGSIIEFALKVM